jgi:hypothetical protein
MMIRLRALAMISLVALLQTQPGQESKPDIRPLTGEFKTQLEELKRRAEDALKEKAFFESQVEKADLKLATARAEKDTLFARFCAKNSLDPDEFEWTQDLSGVRRKAVQLTPKEPSKESSKATSPKPK